MFNEGKTSQQLRKLEKHLKQENPILAEVVQNFRELDRISRRLGFFGREQSHATAMPWWPLISVLGIYSAGKSSFINSFIDYDLQAVGIQAVDDKFTVICFSREEKPRILPGLALDADPRFPLYKISRAIEEVARGENIDAYLQLKTCPSEKLRGKILIDSPGFDADAQRTSTLRITDHIIDLSDLVLVFFDARHPESGSMRDTLEHLVKATINRRDSNKFLYILNQIDVTAREDNLEEVFAAWQRALAQYGLTAGSSYSIYNLDAAVAFEDDEIRERFETKRQADMDAINSRIEQVGVERAYRIIGTLEQTARMLKNEVVPLLQRFMEGWRRKTLWLEGGLAAVTVGLLLALTIRAGYWQGLSPNLPSPDVLVQHPYLWYGLIAILLTAAIWAHLRIRSWIAAKTAARLLKEIGDENQRGNYLRAFRKSSRWCRSLLLPHPAGWSQRTAGVLDAVIDASNTYIQKLNDLYTNPSGKEDQGPAGTQSTARKAPAADSPSGDAAHRPHPSPGG